MRKNSLFLTILHKVRTRLIILTILTALLLVIASRSQAQSFTVSAFVEQNITGTQKGFRVGTQVFHKLSIGYFYQATHKMTFEHGADNSNYPFHGLSAQLPIKSCEGLAFKAGIKTGLVNNTFLIATPELVTEISITRHLLLNISSGYRAGHPAIGTGLTLSL